MNDVHELEIYAPIDGFPNYLVTSHGGVLSLKDNHNNDRLKELKSCKSKGGYYFVSLCKNGKRYNKYVHRLVAQAFISNPENKPQVNHIDEDKTNNHVSNLEWMTGKENCNHGTHNERLSKILSDGRLKGEYNPMYGKKHTEETKQNLSKIKSRKVIGKNKTKTQVIVFKSALQAEKFGFNNSCISQCCNNKIKLHKGYTWQFIDDEDKNKNK